MKLIHFDCFSGIAGDMTVGALLSLGLPFEYLTDRLDRLHLDSYEVSRDIIERHQIAAIHFKVKTLESTKHRHLPDILTIIDRADLNDRIKKTAGRIFEKLAEAEARVHNSSIEKVHFHEVGAVDAIVDIVGAAIGIDYFGP